MATPTLYRKLAKRLESRRLIILLFVPCYVVVWVAYAIISTIREAFLPWYIHNTIFVDGAWLVPVTFWFGLLFALFGDVSDRRNGSSGDESGTSALPVMAAVILNVYAAFLVVAPILWRWPELLRP